jgi:hypothetical protein
MTCRAKDNLSGRGGSRSNVSQKRTGDHETDGFFHLADAPPGRKDGRGAKLELIQTQAMLIATLSGPEKVPGILRVTALTHKCGEWAISNPKRQVPST